MERPGRANAILGLVAIVFALVLLGVWIPLDTDTGIVEQARRRVIIGDALAPTVAALFILLGGLGLLTVERRGAPEDRLSAANLVHLAAFLGLIAVSFLLMRWTGPIAVALFAGGDEPAYRLLRDTPPWKYLGFAAGGTVLVAGMISLVEGRFGARALLIGVVAVLAMIAIYDLPFDDLLLPPNGDV